MSVLLNTTDAKTKILEELIKTTIARAKLDLSSPEPQVRQEALRSLDALLYNFLDNFSGTTNMITAIGDLINHYEGVFLNESNDDVKRCLWPVLTILIRYGESIDLSQNLIEHHFRSDPSLKFSIYSLMRALADKGQIAAFLPLTYEFLADANPDRIAVGMALLTFLFDYVEVDHELAISTASAWLSSDNAELSYGAHDLWQTLIDRKIGMTNAVVTAGSCISHTNELVRSNAFRIYLKLFQQDQTLTIIPKEAADAFVNDVDFTIREIAKELLFQYISNGKVL